VYVMEMCTKWAVKGTTSGGNSPKCSLFTSPLTLSLSLLLLIQLVRAHSVHLRGWREQVCAALPYLYRRYCRPFILLDCVHPFEWLGRSMVYASSSTLSLPLSHSPVLRIISTILLLLIYIYVCVLLLLLFVVPRLPLVELFI